MKGEKGVALSSLVSCSFMSYLHPSLCQRIVSHTVANSKRLRRFLAEVADIYARLGFTPEKWGVRIAKLTCSASSSISPCRKPAGKTWRNRLLVEYERDNPTSKCAGWRRRCWPFSTCRQPNVETVRRITPSLGSIASIAMTTRFETDHQRGRRL